MATTYNVQVEDSEGNKYYTKPDLLTTEEQLKANTKAGKSVDALVVKELNNKLTSVRTYVGSDGKLHSVDGTGADTVLNFSNIKYKTGQYTISGSNTHTVDVDGEIIGVVTLAISGASPTGGAWFKDAGYDVKGLNAIKSVNDSTVTFATWYSNSLTFEYCICYK